MSALNPNPGSDTNNQFIVGDSVLTLVEPAALAPTLDGLLHAAKHRIHAEFYILRNDPVGIRFVRLCVDKARAGVQVTLIRDNVGSFREPWPLQGEMDLAGVRYIDYNPIWPPHRWWHKVPPTHRNHRKILVIDDELSLISTGNVGREYTDLPVPDPHWDLSVVIRGPLTAELVRVAQESQRTILRDRRPDPLPEHEPMHNGRVLADIHDAWGRGEAHYILQWYLRAIEQARDHILIANPYFLPHRYLRRALMQAARRGVRVELILPQMTDWPAVRHAMQHLYRAFLAAGVEIHEVQHQIVHAKAFTVDGCLSSLGSFNFDRWSVQDNLEANLVVEDAAFTHRLNELIHQQKARAVQLSYPLWAQRSRWSRLISWIWWRLRAGL